MSSGVALEVSIQDVSIVLQSDALELEVGSPTVDILLVPTVDVMDIIITGPQGPAGPAGGTYVHTQASPAATWTIPHNLNTILSVVILLDSAPTVPVYTDVTYPDLNHAVLTFPSAESGKAYLR